jgi:hypothetical protein
MGRTCENAARPVTPCLLTWGDLSGDGGGLVNGLRFL